jgi:hypothetical protein
MTDRKYYTFWELRLHHKFLHLLGYRFERVNFDELIAQIERFEKTRTDSMDLIFKHRRNL